MLLKTGWTVIQKFKVFSSVQVISDGGVIVLGGLPRNSLVRISDLPDLTFSVDINTESLHQKTNNLHMGN